MSAPRTLQLVSARGELAAADLDEFAATAFPDFPDTDDEGATLVTVAILGARGSGKSTLANRLFGTHFPVGKPFAARGTTGCVAAVSAAGALILDTQGTDGRDGDTHLVPRVTTLAITLADALVYNVWAADLGRHEAAGYGLLRTVFLEHTKIFIDEEPVKTLLVFVIRDHDDGSSLDSLKALLLTDVRAIWAQVHSSGKPLEELFDFDFVSLPHIRHRSDEFDAAVTHLAARFNDHDHPEALLKPEHSKKVPVEGLFTYAELVWKETDLDQTPELPAKKELVAAYRCDVAYDAQQRPAVSQLNRWTSEVDRGRVVSTFGDKASALLDTALEKYDRDTATHASSNVRAKKRSELQTALQARIRALFNKQILLLQSAALQRFKDILLSNVTNPMYETDTPAALRRVDEWFARKAESLLVRSMKLSFRSARQEVQNALHTFGEGFANSPTAQLQAMQQMERQAQRAPPRQRNIEFGLGINAACRPSGYGNFQLVTGYARGPHTMQFTLVNDKDAAEQEGQGNIPFFRIQPTINTTVDL